MTPFDHRRGSFVPVEDAVLYVETAGNPDGKPLVLLHGGLGSLEDFNSCLDQLSPDFRLIAIDLRGHGRSTLGTARLTYARHQADVEAVLDHLGVTSCALVGFSDGGIIGYRMAATIPSKIERLITLGAQWRISTDDPAFEILGGVTPELWQEMFPASIKTYEEINPAPNFKALVAAVTGLWTDLSTESYPGETVTAIGCPLLIVRGDNDPFLSLRDAAALRDKVENSAFLNVPFVGHEVHAEAVTIFAEVVGAFLKAA